MKKNIIIICTFILIASVCVYKSTKHEIPIKDITLKDIESFALHENGGDSESGGDKYSCTVTSNCISLSGVVTGSVSCTGKECSRGVESGGLFGIDVPYVECDGKRTRC